MNYKNIMLPMAFMATLGVCARMHAMDDNTPPTEQEDSVEALFRQVMAGDANGAASIIMSQPTRNALDLFSQVYAQGDKAYEEKIGKTWFADYMDDTHPPQLNGTVGISERSHFSQKEKEEKAQRNAVSNRTSTPRQSAQSTPRGPSTGEPSAKRQKKHRED